MHYPFPSASTTAPSAAHDPCPAAASIAVAAPTPEEQQSQSPQPYDVNPFPTTPVYVLDVVDPLLFLAGLATNIAFIVDAATHHGTAYAALLWVSVVLQCASWWGFVVAVCAYPSTFLHPRTEAALLRLWTVPRLLLVVVVSPVLPALTWLHWKLQRRAFAFKPSDSGSHVHGVLDGNQTLPLPLALRDFDATSGERVDGVRRIVHGVLALTCAPRRLLLLDAAHALPRCAVQFAAITFTSGSATQYVAVVVSMVTVLSKAHVVCGRSTQVSTFVFKVALVAFDLFGLFYILSLQTYFKSDSGADFAMTMTWVVTALLPGARIGLGALMPCIMDNEVSSPWGLSSSCTSCSFILGYLAWLITCVLHIPMTLLLLLSAKMTFLLRKTVLDADSVEARRLLVNFVTQRGSSSGPQAAQRVLHLYQWFQANMPRYSPTPELEAAVASGSVSAWNGWLPDGGLSFAIAFVTGPMVLFGIAYPFAHFATHAGDVQQSALSLTLFGCMLAALGVALVLVPRMVMVSYVNCLMEPAFRQVVVESRAVRATRTLTVVRSEKVCKTAVWTLGEARRCVAAYYVVPIGVALPLAIGVQVLPPDVVTSCIAPYMDTASTTATAADVYVGAFECDVDEWRMQIAHA